jgi:hypothetical protein
VAVSRRQQASAYTTSQVASLNVSLPGSAPAGDFLVVGVVAGNEVPVVGGVTDDGGAIYVRDVIGLGVGAVGALQRCALYSEANLAGGSMTITYTPSTNQYLDVILSEYAGVVSTSALDTTGSGGSDTAGTSQDSGTTGLPNSPDALAVALLATTLGANEIATAGSPFVEVSGGGGEALPWALADRFLTVAEEQLCTWTTSGAWKWDSCIAVYLPGQPGADEVRGYNLGEVGEIAGRYPQDLEV